MSVTMEDVLHKLDAYEPAYTQAAQQLGRGALPHLKTLAQGIDPFLATKAVYLAGLLGGDEAIAIVQAAIGSPNDSIRTTAAYAAQFMPENVARSILLTAIADPQVSVRKFALISAGIVRISGLKSQIEAIAQNDPDELIKDLAFQTGPMLP